MRQNTSTLEPIIVRSIFDSPKFIRLASLKLDSMDFEDEFCSRVFEIMDNLNRRKKKVTIASVKSFLNDDESLEEFLDFQDGTLDEEEFGQYVDNVHEKATSRFAEVTLDGAIEQIRDQKSEGLKGLTTAIQQANRKIAERAYRGTTLVNNGKKLVTLFFQELTDRASIEGDVKGLKTNFREIDDKMNGLMPGKYIVIAGRPGMGKTTLAINFAESACVAGKRVLVFSQEMPGASLMMRIIARQAQVDVGHLQKAKLSQQEAERVKEAADRISEWDINICDQGGITAEFFATTIEQENDKAPLDLIVLDYLQLCSLAGLDGSTKNDKLGELSKMIKALALNLGVPILVLSQLNRDLEKRPDKRPINADLRDTGAIEQDADIIMFTYRDVVYDPDTRDKNIAEAICTKNRDGEMFTSRIIFEGHLSQFRDIPMLDEPAQDQQQGQEHVSNALLM
jgi:replicative DNA helicase